jgi:fibronectin-binding autotransporter adhesin
LALGGANTYSGDTILNDGILVVGNSAALGSGSLNFNGGELQASGAQTVNNPITVGYAVFLGGGAGDSLTLTSNINLGNSFLSNFGINSLTGVISGGGAVYVNGGALTLSGANTYAGGTYLYNGTLVAANDAALSASALFMGSTPFSPGGTLEAGGVGPRTLANAIVLTLGVTPSVFNTINGVATNDLTLTGGIDLAGNYLTFGGTGNITISTIPIQDSVSGGSITKSGTSTLLAGADNILGSSVLNLNGGTLAGTLPASAPARMLSNATVNLGGDFTFGTGVAATNQNLTFTGTAVNITAPHPTFTVNNTTTIQGAIADTGSGFTKAGPGTLVLSGANTYSGGTTLTAGTLGIGCDSFVSEGRLVSGALGTGTLTVAIGTLMVPYSGTVLTHTLANDISLNGVLRAGSGNNLTLNGIISGPGQLIEDMC